MVLKVATAGTGKIYYIDRGHANIKVGNRLNVYRVLKINVGRALLSLTGSFWASC